jgi:replicative DNA helicase
MKPIPSANELGKLPPQSIEIEETVLGAIMLEKNAIIEVAGFLRAEHFYKESNKEIYEAIQLLFAAGDPIDMRTVVNQIRVSGKLESVGGAYYIAELTSRVSSAANIESHARILVEYAMKRSLITLGSEMVRDAYDDTVDIFSQIDKSNLVLQEVLDGAIASKSEKSMQEIAANVVQEVSARQSGKHSGLDCGYPVIDAILNGFQPTDLVIVAARPGMGKSAWIVQAGKQIADSGFPVGVISLEMSSQQIVERLAIGECEIDSDKVKKGKMIEPEFNNFMTACGTLARLPMHIDDTPFMTILELRARAMRMKAKHKIKILIVDYLQLIKGSGRQGQNRDQEIGEITRTLKGIAKELEIPVIALSQLSRGLETRGGTKIPQLSDLRESGNIEQDSDVVMFLYRPEYYKITQDEDGYSTHGLCEIIVAKHRNGSLDTVKQKFIGKFTKFTEWTMEQRGDQVEYVKKHYKNPSERDISDFNSDEPPFM